MSGITKEEKELLKSWKSHPGYQIYKKLVDDKLSRLTEKLMGDVDLDNPAHLKVLRDNQIYMRALKDALQIVETNTNEVFVPKSS